MGVQTVSRIGSLVNPEKCAHPRGVIIVCMIAAVVSALN